MKKDGLKENIIKLRQEGCTYNEITNELNCAKSTVSYYCKDLKIKDNFLNDIPTDVINKVIEMRKKGIKYDEIKSAVNITQDKLKKICRMEKLNNPNYYRSPKKEEIVEMQKYYDECGSSVKVSKKFGWSKFTVLKYLNINKRIPQNETQRKQSMVKNVINWRKRTKLKLIEYKGGECIRCGYKKNKNALCFHHKDPKEKDFAISAKSYSFEKLKKEVDKCILVCSNCHIEIHDELKNE